MHYHVESREKRFGFVRSAVVVDSAVASVHRSIAVAATRQFFDRFSLDPVVRVLRVRDAQRWRIDLLVSASRLADLAGQDFSIRYRVYAQPST